MTNAAVPAGKAEKYSRRERERRFLLSRRPDGEPVRRVRIIDRYMTETRLRLRAMADADDDRDVVYKLTQKIPDPDGGPGLITTMYLHQREFEVCAQLPALLLTKTRSSYPPFGVDEFDPPLTGLVIAEIEFDADDEMRAGPVPANSVAEVTDDVRFSGGRLVTTTAPELRRLLVEFGLVRP